MLISTEKVYPLPENWLHIKQLDRPMSCILLYYCNVNQSFMLICTEIVFQCWLFFLVDLYRETIPENWPLNLTVLWAVSCCTIAMLINHSCWFVQKKNHSNVNWSFLLICTEKVYPLPEKWPHIKQLDCPMSCILWYYPNVN